MSPERSEILPKKIREEMKILLLKFFLWLYGLGYINPTDSASSVELQLKQIVVIDQEWFNKINGYLTVALRDIRKGLKYSQEDLENIFFELSPLFTSERGLPLYDIKVVIKQSEEDSERMCVSFSKIGNLDILTISADSVGSYVISQDQDDHYRDTFYTQKR